MYLTPSIIKGKALPYDLIHSRLIVLNSPNNIQDNIMGIIIVKSTNQKLDGLDLNDDFLFDSSIKQLYIYVFFNSYNSVIIEK